MLRGLLLLVLLVLVVPVKSPVLQVVSATVWQPLPSKCVPCCRLLPVIVLCGHSFSTLLSCLRSNTFKHYASADAKPAFKSFYSLWQRCLWAGQYAVSPEAISYISDLHLRPC